MSIYRQLRQRDFWAFFRGVLISGLVGVLAGSAASIFLILLDEATRLRQAHPALMYALPFAGLLIGWAYHAYGRDVAAGNNLILEEMHDPRKVLPVRMAPLVLFGTLVTHLVGGSAGREGAVVQMGATLADQLAIPFGLDAAGRKILLVAGAGAAFGAALGAPWAGVIFGMEVIHVGRLRFFALLECFVASFVAFFVTRLLPVAETAYPGISVPRFSWSLIGWVVAAGVIFGIWAQAFSRATHAVEHLQKRWVSYPPLKPFFGGLLLVLLFHLEGTARYTGLGTAVIREGLTSVTHLRDPLLKGLFTAITLGTGFKGGEFIPLVFMGTTLGSALSELIPVAASFLAALGFAAVFGGAANTPLACSIMAAELFGYRILPYALIACYASYYFSGHHGIYSRQHYHGRKHRRLAENLSALGELPKRFR